MLTFPYSRLEIEDLIIHVIYSRDANKNNRPPKYGNNKINLDEESREIIRQRISKVLGRGTHCVQMKFSLINEGSSYEKIDSLIGNDVEEFIELSKELANRLNFCQSPYEREESAFFVLHGRAGIDLDQRFVCLIKAGSHSGFNLIDNMSEISVELFRKLVLTPIDAFVKVGFFILNGDLVSAHNAQDYEIYIYDDNIHNSNPNQAADYFAKTFLGLSFFENDAQLARQFFDSTSKFINDLNIDDNLRIDLRTNLYTYLKSFNALTIDVQEFMSDFLPQEMWDDFTNCMKLAGIPPHAIHKDLSFLDRELSQRRLAFTSNVIINVPADRFNDTIQIISQDEDQTTLSIKGKLKNDN